MSNIDRSGSITSGGTAQQLMPANPRRGFSVQNLSSSDLWIYEFGTATAASPSLKIPAGALYETPNYYTSHGAVSIYGASTGQSFTAREW